MWPERVASGTRSTERLLLGIDLLRNSHLLCRILSFLLTVGPYSPRPYVNAPQRLFNRENSPHLHSHYMHLYKNVHLALYLKSIEGLKIRQTLNLSHTWFLYQKPTWIPMHWQKNKQLFHFNAIRAPNGIYDRSIGRSISMMPAVPACIVKR